MKRYPAFLDVSNRPCLVVGTGPVAERRARSLQDCEAEVTRFALEDEDESLLEATRAAMAQTDLDQYWLVVAATANPEANAHISEICERLQIFCNVITDADASSFVVPATVDRSPLLIAISSGGNSPILARVLKSKLESLIPAGYARLSKLISRHRENVKSAIPNNAERAHFWQSLINGPVGELAFGHQSDTLDEKISKAIENATDGKTSLAIQSQVALVGAGPGDPDLLTFRALRLIQAADVLVYDRLVSEEVLSLARSDVELIYAGKARSQHTLKQESINDLLVTLAQSGRNVVRLKGGDPFIFGRGGEEIETLAAAGIPFQVVPGITAASGCAAFSGIPLTHRDYAQSCVFVTGHLRNGEINLNWDDLCDPTQTIVVYMGLVGLEQICEKLINIGRTPTTPAALIEQGTTASHRVFKADLNTLPDVVSKSDVSAPTLLIIGGVVELHDTLNWFEPRSR